MNVSILALGTRGDVQPFIALALGLRARGHTVRLAAPDNFAGWVRGHGLEFFPLGVDLESFLQDPEVQKVIGGNPFALAKLWRRRILPLMETTLQATWDASRDCDLIVYHPKVFGAIDVAEATGAAIACAAPIPMVATGAFPLIVSARSYGACLNRLSYRLVSFSRLAYRGIINRWRRERLGLGKGAMVLPIGGTPSGLAPRLCAVSTAVLPRPEDWDDGAHMTGYWFLDENEDWEPDADLKTFLEGEPPVYIGFGSMTNADPKARAALCVDAARQAGVRLLLAGGWGGIDELPSDDRVFFLKAAPHHRLFPRVRAVVHHGGAGTTAAGLRAGRPSLVCPHAVDQPFWGRRVHDLGCGPRPLPAKKLSADRLAARLKELTDGEDFRRAAEAIAERIAAEDGVARAITVLEEAAQRGDSRAKLRA